MQETSTRRKIFRQNSGLPIQQIWQEEEQQEEQQQEEEVLKMIPEQKQELVDPIEARFDWYRATLKDVNPEALENLFTTAVPDLLAIRQKPHFKGFESERGFDACYWTGPRPL
jgi:hypothetical protein